MEAWDRLLVVAVASGDWLLVMAVAVASGDPSLAGLQLEPGLLENHLLLQIAASQEVEKGSAKGWYKEKGSAKGW